MAGLCSQLCQAQAGSPSTESPGHLEASPRGVPVAYTPTLSASWFRTQGAKCVTLAGWGHPFEGYREGQVLGSSVGWVLMSPSGFPTRHYIQETV